MRGRDNGNHRERGWVSPENSGVVRYFQELGKQSGGRIRWNAGYHFIPIFFNLVVPLLEVSLTLMRISLVV
ncbi:hypothetical protein IEQ34_019549 [Dendrobium chrysotoxum]|uniref:Uncharacterized protein n=1 Tax=Dendrobium chrysotoxum TaxID=161865 RepID=A0AAV7FRJ4_DENCH|nr:hypothetical protein IEQ34_019549 [Dendrobium chrysotoxum]